MFGILYLFGTREEIQKLYNTNLLPLEDIKEIKYNGKTLWKEEQEMVKDEEQESTLSEENIEDILDNLLKTTENVLKDEINYKLDYEEIYDQANKKIDEQVSFFQDSINLKDKLEIEKYLRSEERNYYSLYEYIQDNIDFEELIYLNKDINMHLYNLGENKEIESILKYKLDIAEKPITIEEFIKTTDEGRKLISENGDISSVTLGELNEAIEKERW